VCSRINGVGPDPAFKYRKRDPSVSVAYRISPEGDHERV
jgi:hypothetical protein